MRKTAAMFIPNAEVTEFPVHRARPMRIRSRVPVTIIDDIGRELEAIIGNFSKDGFMAECETKLPVYSVIETTHPHFGAIKAEIRWSDGWRFGALILR